MKTTILILALICLGGVAARTAGNACLAGQYSVESKICQRCSSGTTFNGCLACDATKCTQCAEGYELNDKGSCTMFHASCAEKLCDISGTQACGQCRDGFRPARKDTTDTAYCVACAQGNCASCTVEECTECNAGFFLENKACTACSSGCVDCTSATACTTCGAGFFLNNGACTACGTGCSVCTAADKCTTCSLNNILNSTTGACTTKDGCEEGDGADKCKTCRDGFRLLADGSCKACDSNAQTCEGSGTDQTILTCNPGLILATATATAKAACQTRTDGVCLNQDAAGVCSKCEGASWVVSKGKCVLCSSILTNCKSCQAGDATTAATCSACIDKGYATGSPITSCTACASNCDACTAAGCTTCAEGFFKATATATTCTSCDAGGAKSCTVARNAASCLDGYGAQEHGICWKCDPNYNCKTCTEYQKCATCATGSAVQTAATPAATANSCVVCDVNCAASTCPDGPGTCAGATAGSECTAPFKLNTVTKKCTQTCEAANCNVCNTNDYSKCGTTAGNCKEGYRENAGECTLCQGANTRTCSSTLSTGCKNGYSFSATATDNQFCTTLCVPSANVLECTWLTAAPTFGTYVCKPGYGIGASAGLCEACTDANCADCAGAKAVCNACKDGFHTTAACVACPNTKAATCSSATVDVTCKVGNVLGTVGGNAQCVTKAPNCKAGATSGTASADITGDNICPAGQCADGWTDPASGRVCIQCTVANCNVCATATATTACTTCKTGYSKKTDNTCMANIADNTVDGCVRTNGTYEKCTSCLDGWYLDGTTCKACPANCKCAAVDTCDSCVLSTNFHDTVSTPKACKTCSVANCLNCSADAAKCTECKAGFFKESDTKCTACTTDCASCTKADACDTCAAGFVSFALPTGVTGSVKYCAACVANCKACTVKTDGTQTCTECNANYYLSGKSCTNADCSGTDGKACNRCLYGKVLKDGKCADCTGDNSCPVSCNSVNGTTTGPTGGATNTSTATDSGSKIAFSLFVLAFFAILGHMMI